MFNRIVLLLFLFCGLSVSAAFLPATEDVPLMDGIVLTETSDFLFDTPAGQILTLSAKTQKEIQEIRTFYHDTLLSLGWQKKSSDFYVRGSDTFQLTFPNKNEVRFDILLSNN